MESDAVDPRLHVPVPISGSGESNDEEDSSEVSHDALANDLYDELQPDSDQHRQACDEVDEGSQDSGEGRKRGNAR